MKLIHISDLHYHRHFSDNKEADALLSIIKKKYPKHGLIVSGDIADDGHEKQFQNAFEALEPFIGRVFIAPGNHDFGALGNFYSYERARRFDEMLSNPLKQGGTFKGDNTPVVNIMEEGNDRLMIIALDTNLETNHPFDFACGEVGAEQMDALANILSSPADPSMKKLLFFHHHPFIHNDPFMELKDARELMRTIYNKVDVVLFGHKHVLGTWENINGIRYVLASDNSPGKDWVREITLKDGEISVKEVSTKPTQSKKKPKGK
jgi:3',5'-cyclic AMP phosphodiesterase CpdA